MRINVSNPTPFTRTQHVIVGSDSNLISEAIFRQFPRSNLGVYKVTVPPFYYDYVDALPENYSDEFQFHPVILSSFNSGFNPFGVLNGQKVNFQPIQNIVAHSKIRVDLLRARFTNGVANLYTYSFSNSPIVKYELTFNLESLAQPSMPVNFSFGVDGNAKFINAMRYGNPNSLINTNFDDCQGRMWMGSFCFYTPEMFTLPEYQETLATLAAEVSSPLYGLAEWNTWGAFRTDFKNIPLMNIPLSDIRGEYFQRVGAPYWDTLGHFGVLGNKDSGTTGDQGGFGPWQNFNTVCSGSSSLMFFDALATNQEYCRPVGYYETNGDRVSSTAHGQWVTWSQRTHGNNVVSPDRMYRTHNMTLLNPWTGYDRQHDSSTCMANQVILNGSFACKDWLKGKIEAYLAGETVPSMKPGWSTNDIEGGGRGMGRPFLSYVYCWLATGDARILERGARRVVECLKPYYDSTNNNAGTMKVLRVITNDSRVFNGQPGWICWEDCIAVMGMQALLMALQETNMGLSAQMILNDIIWNVSKTITMHAFLKDRVQIAQRIRWDNTGNPIADPLYNDINFVVPGDETDYKSWALPALAIAKKLATLKRNAVVQQEAQRLIDAILAPNRAYERIYVGAGI